MMVTQQQLPARCRAVMRAAMAAAGRLDDLVLGARGRPSRISRAIVAATPTAALYAAPLTALFMAATWR